MSVCLSVWCLRLNQDRKTVRIRNWLEYCPCHMQQGYPFRGQKVKGQGHVMSHFFMLCRSSRLPVSRPVFMSQWHTLTVCIYNLSMHWINGLYIIQSLTFATQMPVAASDRAFSKARFPNPFFMKNKLITTLWQFRWRSSLAKSVRRTLTIRQKSRSRTLS